MLSLARVSVSAFRWVSGARTRPFSRLAMSSSAACPAVWSALLSTRMDEAPFGSRCRRANSISAVRKRHRTSAPLKCCSPCSRACTRSITAREDWRSSPAVCIGSRVSSTLACGGSDSSVVNADVFRHADDRHRRAHRRDPRGGGEPRRKLCGASTPGTSALSLDETTRATTSTCCGRYSRRRALRCLDFESLDASDRRRAARGSRAHLDVSHASDVQPVSLGNRDAALSAAPRRQGHRAGPLDDSARLVHDEAQRGERDDAGHMARIRAHASVRAGEPDGRLPRNDRRASSACCAQRPDTPPCRCSRTRARKANTPDS